ncbi:hypothetical protein [Streptomyces sp. NPDC006335]|uniref:hypothetical protein n=1 Tax=Streptomyces sp. NPDC006335 TaxID=3156895 RepID=UPI0033AC2041
MNAQATTVGAAPGSALGVGHMVSHPSGSRGVGLLSSQPYGPAGSVESWSQSVSPPPTTTRAAHTSRAQRHK